MVGQYDEVRAIRIMHVGCAGWNIHAKHADLFMREGAHLERYASRFPCVEINSSFYRPHRPATYARWAASVPDGFRFAVKMPKEITHARRLQGVDELLDRFLCEVGELGAKLGPVLVQLPPSRAFDPTIVAPFLDLLRRRFIGDVVCEPRHPSWFDARVEELQASYNISRVAADPAVVPAAAVPGGSSGLVYYRLHGSPRVYYSPYAPDYLRALATTLAAVAQEGRSVWCIFDNTAEGAATLDALRLLEELCHIQNKQEQGTT